jgi:hypothetical protein
LRFGWQMQRQSQKMENKMNFRSWKTYRNLPAILFFTIVPGLMFYRAWLVKKDHRFTIGVVTSVGEPGYRSTGDYAINYEYYLDGHRHYMNFNSKFCGNLTIHELNERLSGKHVAVAYSTQHPGDCVLLITLEMAEKYHFVMPDSLKVYDSLLTCK